MIQIIMFSVLLIWINYAITLNMVDLKTPRNYSLQEKEIILYYNHPRLYQYYKIVDYLTFKIIFTLLILLLLVSSFF